MMIKAALFNFGLAPMEGVSDFPFRLWLSMTSDPDWCCTPFLRVTGSYPRNKIPVDFAPELGPLRGAVRYRLYPQLMAATARDFVRVAETLLAHAPYVELNCGCPAPNAVGSGAGSSLLREATSFHRFIKEAADALGAEQLAVKMRLGFEHADEFHELLRGLESMPLRQLTVHGRTREDRYSALAKWDYIELASRQLVCPVIGSGDILSWSSVLERKQHLAAIKNIIVGRGALRNPWIFQLLRYGQDQIYLSAEALIDSLLCYALLVELHRNKFHELLDFVAAGHFQTPCFDNAERWAHLLEQLLALRFGSSQRSHLQELDRAITGRVKLLWNYLRSSLADEFFSPALLRIGNIWEFSKELAELGQQHEKLKIAYARKYDWVYTSDRKDPGIYRKLPTEAQLTSVSL